MAKDAAKGALKNQVIVGLDGISFDVKKGEMLGIIGLNGGGKTTLLRTISGIYQQDTGTIEIHGKMAPQLQVGVGFHQELNARDNIIMSGLLLGMKKHEIESKIESIMEFAELDIFAEMKLKNFSSGMKVRLGFSTALQINPDILLIDEILSVGDAHFREKSFQAFLDFKKSKKTILYATHNLAKLEELCDRVILIHKGKQEMIDKPQEVVKKYQEILKQIGHYD